MNDQDNNISSGAGTNPFGIDLEDLVETENTALAWMLKQFLKFFLLLLSAATTAAFFFTYAGDAFTNLLGSASPWITALVGALSLDGLSQVWAYLRGHQANTVRQMTTARLMGWVDLLLSLMTTVVYLALTTAFDIGIHAPDGSLSPLGQALNITGILVIIMAIGGNFLAYFYYNDNDLNNQAAVQRNTLQATINQANHIINRERLNRTVNQTVAGIFSELPAHTRQAANANKNTYIEQHYGHLKKVPYLNGKLEATAPPGPTQNYDLYLQCDDGNKQFLLSSPNWASIEHQIDVELPDVSGQSKFIVERNGRPLRIYNVQYDPELGRNYAYPNGAVSHPTAPQPD